ncbi:MAG: DNA alkylation repair protein [bacterium]|nr:DNA alkylation repair protein [bacterium]
MTSTIIANIRAELKKQADKKTRESAQRFFKEEIKFYGVKSALVKKITRAYFKQIKTLDKKEIFYLCEELFTSDYSEEAFIAAEWAFRLEKKYVPEDFQLFAKWVKKYINNWAKCDTFCNHAVGALVEKYPALLPELKVWARSDNRWVKRAAAVTLILPARRGKFLKEALEIADILLLDQDDLVQKGYGWLLKEASRQHQQEVFAYLMKHKKIIPRTAFRYALEKMSPPLKNLAMAK